MDAKEIKNLKKRYLIWFYKTAKEALDKIERKFTQTEIDKFILKELKAKTLVNVFPQLKLLEDNFYVYQKVKRAGLERHRNLVGYLKNIKATQLERA